MSLPRYSINKPVTIFMIFCGALILGFASLSNLPVELMPNTSFGNVTIFINVRGGIPPVEIEERITRPIEEAVSSASHIKSIESTSEEASATIVIKFEPGTNMDFAALEVREKFARVKNELPEEIEKPVIAKYEYSDVPIMILAMTGGKRYTPEMLGKIVDESLKTRLERINGVADIEIGGRRERKILVEIIQKKLDAYNMPINKVINVLGANNLNLLAGDIERTKDKFLARIIGEFATVEDIENIGIAATQGGTIIRLKDLAKVKDSYLEATSYARTNLAPTVSIYIQKESMANTLRMTDALLKEIDQFKDDEELSQKGIRIIPVYNQGDFIRKAIKDVQSSLLFGAFLAVFVLWMFLRDIGSTITIALAIPTAIIFTFILMFFQKLTLNVMTLSGLALGSGMLVDNAIVVLDNISKKRSRGLDRVEAACTGAEEMWLAIFASTLTTVIVFLPFIFVNKEIRLLYEGLAMTIVYALLASLIVAVTIVPLLSSRLGKKRNESKTEAEEVPDKKMDWFYEVEKKKSKLKKQTNAARMVHTLQRFYRRLLGRALRFRLYLVIAVFCIFGIAFYAFTEKLGMEFLGKTEENEFTVFIELPTGAKLDVSDEVVKQVEAILAEVAEIKTVSSRIKPWSNRVFVKLVPLAQRERSNKEIIDELREKVKEVPNAFIYFEEPQSMAAKELHVEIYGYDYNTLREIASNISKTIGGIPGFVDVKIRMREKRPELLAVVDKGKAAKWGLTVSHISDAVHAKMRGLVATRFHSEAKEVETIVRLRREDRKTFDDVHKLTLVTEEGERVYFEQVADFRPGEGPTEIWRKNKQRMIEVSATMGKYDLNKSVEIVKEALKDMKLPKNYYYRFGGDYEKMLKGKEELIFVIWVTLALIYMVLASLFASFIQPLVILSSVPLSLIGVTAALWAFHKPKSVSVFIGIVMLAGIVVNNAIILVDRINYFTRERNVNRFKAAILAGVDRLRPIMMTTFTTLFGLLPMALDRTEGAGLWAPLAITVLGGLSVSTLLTLFIVPSIFLLFTDTMLIFKPKKKKTYEYDWKGFERISEIPKRS
ncbi:MAG: efflux RND transporter permease subunit [Candidatus Omnitrophica bacterium]|nr:efflux RND transporter permease subunit [Candidatus Omnitrophota bacterium]MBU4478546.1 efflux RND transporter permease subunit [Candidatus Omnitrophota bacterium]MCG2702857.1 efflux RND transporter permease subunit [Candidatus Omnitrophota bacterium]